MSNPNRDAELYAAWDRVGSDLVTDDNVDWAMTYAIARHVVRIQDELWTVVLVNNYGRLLAYRCEYSCELWVHQHKWFPVAVLKEQMDVRWEDGP